MGRRAIHGAWMAGRVGNFAGMFLVEQYGLILGDILFRRLRGGAFLVEHSADAIKVQAVNDCVVIVVRQLFLVEHLAPAEMRLAFSNTWLGGKHSVGRSFVRRRASKCSTWNIFLPTGSTRYHKSISRLFLRVFHNQWLRHRASESSSSAAIARIAQLFLQNSQGVAPQACSSAAGVLSC
jgi:hypothetical protein